MTTTPSLLPCVCGGEPESCRDIERNATVCWVECRDCIASTPECRVYSTAFRIWNAMQQAAQPDCVGMVPMRWDKDDLMLGDITVGTMEREYHGAAGVKVYSQTWDEDEPRFCSDLYAEADEAAARADLVEYVMGENGL